MWPTLGDIIFFTAVWRAAALCGATLNDGDCLRKRRSVYTCPIEALVNEKWMALCRELGPESVGLATSDDSRSDHLVSHCSISSPWHDSHAHAC
jgi:hypothetical protein